MFSLSLHLINVTALSRISMNIDNSTETLRLSKISLYHIKSINVNSTTNLNCFRRRHVQSSSACSSSIIRSLTEALVLCLLGNLFSFSLLAADCEDSQEEKMKLYGVFLWMLEKQERAMMQAKARPQLVYISHLFSVLPDVSLDAVHEDKQGDDGGRDDQLDHQDAVDSLDEGSPHRLVGLFRF